jgi:hypothetical protein
MLSLPELADHPCLSPFHFHRLFQVRPACERLAVWTASRASNIEPLFLGLAHDNPRVTRPRSSASTIASRSRRTLAGKAMSV